MRSLFLLLMLCGTANASFIGYYPGNDKNGVVADIVDEPVELIGKIETDGYNFTYEGDGDHFDLKYYPVPAYSGIEYPYYLANKVQDGGLFMSGSIEQIGDSFDVDYFTVKAGNGFNLFSWDDGLDFHEWTTYNTCADLSHVSLYGKAIQTPEPSSFVIVGSLMAGLLFMTRRRE